MATLSKLSDHAQQRTEHRARERAKQLRNHLIAIYGAAFGDRWAMVPDDDWLATWADALANYSDAELSKGLAACLALKWPPTLPEFAMACRPPAPVIEQDAIGAYFEAVDGMRRRLAGERVQWSHPAVYHAAVAVGGSSALSSTTTMQMLPRFRAAFTRELARGSWPAIPDAPAALVPIDPLSPENRRAAAHALAVILAGMHARTPARVQHHAPLAADPPTDPQGDA